MYILEVDEFLNIVQPTLFQDEGCLVICWTCNHTSSYCEKDKSPFKATRAPNENKLELPCSIHVLSRVPSPSGSCSHDPVAQVCWLWTWCITACHFSCRNRNQKEKGFCLQHRFTSQKHTLNSSTEDACLAQYQKWFTMSLIHGKISDWSFITPAWKQDVQVWDSHHKYAASFKQDM